jgi:hypothetical protein
VTDAPASYRPDYAYPGLPDPLPNPPVAAVPPGESAPPRQSRRRRRRYAFLGARLVLAAGAGFGLVSSVITLGGFGPARTSPSLAPARTLLTLSGSGGKKTEAFVTGTDWTVRYAFDCTQVGGPSTFVLREDVGPEPVRYRLTNDLAVKQAGEIPRHDDPGSRYLEIATSCSWTITVTG